MAPNKSKFPVPTRRRPLTSIYNDNYLFGFNFYDDMMTWLNKREVGVDPGPVVTLPSVPETQFRKFAKKKDEVAIKKELEEAAVRTQRRIEKMVPASLRASGSGASGTSRRGVQKSLSFSGFTESTIEAIDAELGKEPEETGTSEEVRRVNIPFDYDRERHLDYLHKRRVRIEGEDEELEERLESAGLKYLKSGRESSLANRIRRWEEDEERMMTREDLKLAELITRSRVGDSGYSSPTNFSRKSPSDFLRKSPTSFLPKSPSPLMRSASAAYVNALTEDVSASPSSWESKWYLLGKWSFRTFVLTIFCLCVFAVNYRLCACKSVNRLESIGLNFPLRNWLNHTT